MAYPTIPHFDAPFVITAKGAKVVDQNTPQEITACVRNILVCPVGFRVENPDFGTLPLQFDNAPLPSAGIEQAVRHAEPRATTEIEEEALTNEQERQLEIRIGS